MGTRRVVVLAYDDVQLLDIAGPLDVFDAAERFVPDSYVCVVASPSGDTIRTSSGLRMDTTPIHDVRGRVDTLLVPGRLDTGRLTNDATLSTSLVQLAERADRLASVCTGAFALAAAGLLDGRQATTHWAMADELQREFPQVTVHADRLVVHDANIRTSGGVASGVDLALDVVAEDLGHATARRVAKWLIVPLRRPGGQAPYDGSTPDATVGHPSIQRVLADIHGAPAKTHDVESLAAAAGFSRRHFARIFRQETGTTPARYVEDVRLERAQELLETSRLDQHAIARRVGFRHAEALRQSFHRRYGLSPRDHRRAFGPGGDAA